MATGTQPNWSAPMPDADSLAFASTGFPETLTVNREPTRLDIDTNNDGRIDEIHCDFNLDGTIDCVQFVADRRTVVYIPSPAPWHVAPTETRFTGGRGDEPARVTFVREYVAPGQWEVNIASFTLCGNRLASAGMVLKTERELADERAEARSLFEFCGGRVHESAVEGARR